MAAFVSMPNGDHDSNYTAKYGRRRAMAAGSPCRRFFLFHFNSLCRLVLRALDPFCKCRRIGKGVRIARLARLQHHAALQYTAAGIAVVASPAMDLQVRSEEHTSELQSRSDLVCRLLLEKKKTSATSYVFPHRQHI